MKLGRLVDPLIRTELNLGLAVSAWDFRHSDSVLKNCWSCRYGMGTSAMGCSRLRC